MPISKPVLCLKMKQGLVGLVNWGHVGILKTTVRSSQAITSENFVTAMVRQMHIQGNLSIIASGCNTAWMNEFLRQLSKAYPDDHIILVMDNAIWHKSQALEIPDNIEFTFIPPYTPEMNPIEQVWAEIRKRGFKNRAFQTLESVIDKLQEIIQGLDSETLKSIVHRKWICSDFEIE